jgi:long-chain-fatty-acid--CoA ligase ACSBG
MVLKSMRSFSLSGNYKTTTCGKSIAGSHLELMDKDKDGNGEICYRGRHIFMGYMKDPQATGNTIDAQGFLHSGDVGKLDEKGFLSITGRIKELIITAGGENIPPVLIEDNIKLHAPFISNVMVIGDRRKFLSCVVTLHCLPDEDGGPTDVITGLTKKKAEELGITSTSVQEVAKDPKFRKAIEEAITAANKVHLYLYIYIHIRKFNWIEQQHQHISASETLIELNISIIPK